MHRGPSGPPILVDQVRDEPRGAGPNSTGNSPACTYRTELGLKLSLTSQTAPSIVRSSSQERSLRPDLRRPRRAHPPCFSAGETQLGDQEKGRCLDGLPRIGDLDCSSDLERLENSSEWHAAVDPLELGFMVP
jgi:hypothetical protein